MKSGCFPNIVLIIACPKLDDCIATMLNLDYQAERFKD